MLTFHKLNTDKKKPTSTDSSGGVWRIKLCTELKFNVNSHPKFIEQLLSDPLTVLQSSERDMRRTLGNPSERKDCKVCSKLCIEKIAGDHPLLVFGECTSEYCKMTRNRLGTGRTQQESALLKVLEQEKMNTMCAVGSGGLFPDLLLLTRYVRANPHIKQLTMYIVEDWKDYFENGGVIVDEKTKTLQMDPFVYCGPDDEIAKDRAVWISMMTLRLATFVSWFKSLGVHLDLIVCESADAYCEYISTATDNFNIKRPQVTQAVDILDNFGVLTLASFYKCALSVPQSVGFTISDGGDIGFMIDVFRTGADSQFKHFGAIDAEARGKKGRDGPDGILKKLTLLKTSTCTPILGPQVKEEGENNSNNVPVKTFQQIMASSSGSSSNSRSGGVSSTMVYIGLGILLIGVTAAVLFIRRRQNRRVRGGSKHGIITTNSIPRYGDR